MSKKRLLLASAVLSMGVLASCGGGGGGDSVAPTATPPTPPPQAREVAKVLVVFQKGTAGTAGANYTYQVATIKSDGSYTLSPIANDAEIDAKLYSRWTFANGAMLLQDENRNVYFYNPSNNRITPLGITAHGFQPHEFFFAAYGDYVAVRTGTNTFRVVDKTGKVSPEMTVNENELFDFAPNFVIAKIGNQHCVIKASAVESRQCTGGVVRDSLANRDHLNKRILLSAGKIWLINPDTGDRVDTGITASSLDGSKVNFEGYRFTKVGSDWYFLFKAGNDWYYARLTGATVNKDKINVSGYNIVDAALDADGKAVVLAYNGNDDRVAVFSNPADTSSYVITTSDALPDKTFGADARIVYLGKGNGIAEASDGTIVAIVGASVPQIGSIPAGFDTNVTGSIILRKDNEMVVASVGNCRYINLANVTNMTANDYISKSNNASGSFTLRGRTSAGTYVADNNGKFFRVTISNNPCDELKNVTRANTTWIKATVATNQASPSEARHFNFFSSKILAHQDAYSTTTCSTHVDAPQAYLLDLDNDTRTVVGPSMRLGCVNNVVGSTVSLKMPYVYDLNTGAVMYGFNPLLNPVCKGVDRFDKLVVNIGNTTAEISKVKDGWCVVTALGIVP